MQMEMPQQSEGIESKPPNLRPSSLEGTEGRCSYCAHYGDGVCTKYDYPVKPHQVSDSFEEEGAKDETEEAEGDTYY